MWSYSEAFYCLFRHLNIRNDLNVMRTAHDVTTVDIASDIVQSAAIMYYIHIYIRFSITFYFIFRVVRAFSTKLGHSLHTYRRVSADRSMRSAPPRIYAPLMLVRMSAGTTT